MRSWFLKRKYPEKLIHNEIKKVRFFTANLQNKKREKGVPFVVIYHPILKSLNKIIRDNMHFLNMSKVVHGGLAVIWFGLSYIHWKEK